MASRSGPAHAVYDSMTLIQRRNDPAKNDESNASLTAKSCPLTHTSPCTTEGSLTKRCLDLRLPPWSAKCWSVCDHDMKLQKWTTMWASLWPSTPLSSIHSIHATHCNTNDYCSWPLQFCCCSHLALPSPQLAPNPPLPPLRIQPGQRLLNNIPQLVKPRKSQGWQASSMESRYLSDSLNIFPCLDVLQLCQMGAHNADDFDDLGVSLTILTANKFCDPAPEVDFVNVWRDRSE